MQVVMKYICGHGGIGRRARFRFWWETVQVQVLLPVLFWGLPETVVLFSMFPTLHRVHFGSFSGMIETEKKTTDNARMNGRKRAGQQAAWSGAGYGERKNR